MKSKVVSQNFCRKKYIALPSSIQCMKLSVIQAKIEFKTPEAQMSSKKRQVVVQRYSLVRFMHSGEIYTAKQFLI